MRRAGCAAVGFVALGSLAGFQKHQERVCGDGSELKSEGAVEDKDIYDENPLAKGGHMLQHKTLLDEEHTTEDKGDEGQSGEDAAQVTGPVVAPGFRHAVSENRLQEHKEHAGRKCHTCANVMQHLGIVHLKVANHGEAGGADPACCQPQGVEEGRPAGLNDVGVSQQANEHHHERAQAADQAEEAALWREGATLADQRNVIQSAA